MKKQGRIDNTWIWAIIGWIVFIVLFGGGIFNIPGMSNLINNTSNGSTITDVPTPYDNSSEPNITFKQIGNYLLILIIVILIYLYIYFKIKKKKGEQVEKKNE